ncbi:hypothetical protein Tco_1310102 [Tanacetum coccineum]
MLQEPEQGTITTTTATITVTAASTRPKAKGLVIHEEEQATTPKVSSQQPSQVNVQDKYKGKMVEPEKPMKKKELISLDKEIATKLQAEFDEKVRLAREKAEKEEEANIISWDNVQAMIDADYKMAQQMQVEEQEELNLQQESIKKRKVDEDKETVELQKLIEVVPDKEEVSINVIPLETKPLSIVNYKIHKEGKKTYYQIIRVLIYARDSTRPDEGYERVLWGDLKTMFDPHVKDQLSMKKLEILKKNIKFRGGLLGLKDFMMILELLLLRYYC